jgi:hypothetical protein
MPTNEFLTGDFYTPHAIRFLNGAPPQGRWIVVVIATGAFAVRFATIADSNVLPFAFASMLVCFRHVQRVDGSGLCRLPGRAR